MELQWPLIIFTTFMAWAAGTFGTQGIVAIRKFNAKSQFVTLIVAFAVLVIGGIAVMFHLQHWERIFNGFGHVTSGITQELALVVVVFIVMVIFFAFMRRNGADKIPVWACVLAPVSGAALVAIMGHSYMLASRPAWDTVMQIMSLEANGAAMGSITVLITMKLRGDEAERLIVPALICNIVNVVVLVAYLIVMNAASSAFTELGYYYDPTQIARGMIDAATVTGAFSSAHIALSISAIASAVIAAVIIIVLLVRRGSVAGKGSEGSDTTTTGSKTATVSFPRRNWLVTCGIALAFAIASAILLRVVFYDLGLSIYMFY